MSEFKRVLAVDLGASSGRVILRTYDGSRIVTEELHRFANTPLHIGGDLHWNVLELFQEIKQGIRLACSKYGELLSLSVDTYGVWITACWIRTECCCIRLIITEISGCGNTASSWKSCCRRGNNSA